MGGLIYWETVNLFKNVAARGRVVGVDLVEIVPGHDAGDITSLLAARLIVDLTGALAHRGRRGLTPRRRGQGSGPYHAAVTLPRLLIGPRTAGADLPASPPPEPSCARPAAIPSAAGSWWNFQTSGSDSISAPISPLWSRW
jgi:hypothetical protein